jgi:hypothetical protein
VGSRQVSPAMKEHRRLVVWWLTGAGALLVILLAFGGYFLVSTVSSFAHGVGCLPVDFPNYPKAAVVEVDLAFGTPVQGDTRECRMRLSSRDEYQSVNTFFRNRLNSRDWVSSRYSEDSVGSVIAFYMRTRKLTYGMVTMHKLRGDTPFEVQLFS